MQPQSVVAFVRQELQRRADPERAPQMAAYMKTTTPFYGVLKPGREAVWRLLKPQLTFEDHDRYVAVVEALWNQPHREEKYLALQVARAGGLFVDTRSLPLYERLIREGAWWGFVDEVASHLVGTVWQQQRSEVGPMMDRWIGDVDFWIRRGAILGQLRHKTATDTQRLFAYALQCGGDKEFFIRKAIGWALRQYSYTNPEAVRDFVTQHRQQLSALTVREAMRRLT